MNESDIKLKKKKMNIFEKYLLMDILLKEIINLIEFKLNY